MTDPTQAKPRTRRGIKIALGLSLAINLLILGAIGGAMLNGHPDGPIRDRVDLVRTLGLGPLGRALDRDDRNQIVARVGQDRAVVRAEREALLAATLAFVTAVEADPFDREATAAALAQQRDHVRGLQERGHGALMEQLERMSPAARAEFADRLRHSLDHHRTDRR
jgi:hypothetical protein